jgi:hypothetical protein
MEPNDLKANRPDDAELEAWLRDSASLPALSDSGFSHRVLAALPSPQRSHFPSRLFVCLAGALAGVVVAVWPVLAAGNPLDRLPALDTALLAALRNFAHPATGLAIATTVASLLFAFWSDLRRLVR